MTRKREIDTPTWTAFDLAAALASTGEKLTPQSLSNTKRKKPKKWLPEPNDRKQGAQLALLERRSWAGTSITDDGAPRASPPLRKTRRLSSTAFPSPLLPLPAASIPPIRQASAQLASLDQKPASPCAPTSHADAAHENQCQTAHLPNPSQEESYRYATCIINGLNDLEKSLMRVSKDLRYVCVNIRADSGSLVCPDEAQTNDDDTITAIKAATDCAANSQSGKPDSDVIGNDVRDPKKDKENTVTSFHDFVYALSKRVLADVFVLNKIFRKRTTPILAPVLDAFRQCGASVSSDSTDLQTLTEIADRMFRNPEKVVPVSSSRPPSKTTHHENSGTPTQSVRNRQHHGPTHARLVEACKNGIDRTLYPKFVNDNDLDLTDYDLAGYCLPQEDTMEFWANEDPTVPHNSLMDHSSPDHPSQFAVNLAVINEPFANTASSIESLVPPPLPQFRLSKPMTPPVIEKHPRTPLKPLSSSSPMQKSPVTQTPLLPHSTPSLPKWTIPYGDSPPVPRKQQSVTVVRGSSEEDEIHPAAAKPQHSIPRRPTVLPRRREFPKNGLSPLYRHPRSSVERLPPNSIRPRTPGSQIHQSALLPSPQRRAQISRSPRGTNLLPLGLPNGLRSHDSDFRSNRAFSNGRRCLQPQEDFTHGRGRKRSWQHINHDSIERDNFREPGLSSTGNGMYNSQTRFFRPADPRRRDLNTLRNSNQVPLFDYCAQKGSNNVLTNRRAYGPNPAPNFEHPQRIASVFSSPLAPLPRFHSRRPTRPSESCERISPRRDTPIVELD